MSHDITLSTWGDIGNIILGISSLFTAIVTAIVLCKQHKLQQKQHKLEQEKLKIQQMEHQPLFFFKRGKDHLAICNSGTKLNRPIEFAIGSMIYVQSSMFLPDGLKNFVYCCPINIYKSLPNAHSWKKIEPNCTISHQKYGIVLSIAKS